MKTGRRSISSLAVFTPIKSRGYNVSFPEYPGCVTFGHTIEEAQKKAEEVLELWLPEKFSEDFKNGKMPANETRFIGPTEVHPQTSIYFT